LRSSQGGFGEVIQYLVTTFKDSTGRPHEHITVARDNQTFTVIEAESKEEAERKYEAQVKIRRDGDAKENGND
ncbi:phage protein, partial [Staphylococcus aureus OCMM6035]